MTDLWQKPKAITWKCGLLPASRRKTDVPRAVRRRLYWVRLSAKALYPSLRRKLPGKSEYPADKQSDWLSANGFSSLLFECPLHVLH